MVLIIGIKVSMEVITEQTIGTIMDYYAQVMFSIYIDNMSMSKGCYTV